MSDRVFLDANVLVSAAWRAENGLLALWALTLSGDQKGTVAPSERGHPARPTGDVALSQLVWLDRTGKQMGVLGDPRRLAQD